MTLKHVHKSVDSLNLLRKTIITKNLIKGTEHVLLSISGGQDSICLLFLMNQLSAQMDLKLSLFWCHHLWQIDSFFLMREITKIGFLFQLDGSLTITPKFVSSELLARNWRHNCSSRLCFFYNYSKIILAHSANDKVETMLLNLLRGAGITGLAPLAFKSTNSIANQEHLLSFSIFPMFLFSWSPPYIDLLTLHAKNVQKSNQYSSSLLMLGNPNNMQPTVAQAQVATFWASRRQSKKAAGVIRFKAFNLFQSRKATGLSPEELQVPIKKVLFPQNIKKLSAQVRNTRKQAITAFIKGALSGAPLNAQSCAPKGHGKGQSTGQDESQLDPVAYASQPKEIQLRKAEDVKLDALQPYVVRRNTLSAFFEGIQQTNFSGHHKYSAATSRLSSVFFERILLCKLKGGRLAGRAASFNSLYSTSPFAWHRVRLEKEVAATSINTYVTTYHPKETALQKANLFLSGLQSINQIPKGPKRVQGKKETAVGCKENDFSGLENCKIMFLAPMFPTLPQRASYPFGLQQVTRLSFFSVIKIPKYGKFYRKFLALRYIWKTPYIMLTPQMTTFFPITLKITLFPTFNFPKTITHLQHICPVFLLPFLSFTTLQNELQHASFDPDLEQSPVPRRVAPYSVSYGKGIIDVSRKKQNPFEKKQILWISEKIFLKKYKKISFLKSFSSNQMSKKSLNTKCYKTRILDQSKKTYKQSEYTPRGEKTKKWFVFVSFTFLKACYTSLQQMQIQQYGNKNLFGIVKPKSLQDTFCIDLTDTSAITKYSKNINLFFFWHYQFSNSKSGKLNKLPWKEKNISFLFAYKQLKINVPQDVLFVDFLKKKIFRVPLSPFRYFPTP